MPWYWYRFLLVCDDYTIFLEMSQCVTVWFVGSGLKFGTCVSDLAGAAPPPGAWAKDPSPGANQNPSKPAAKGRSSFNKTYPTRHFQRISALFPFIILDLSHTGGGRMFPVWNEIYPSTHFLLQRKTSRRGSTCSPIWTHSPIQTPSAKLAESTNFTTRSTASSSWRSEMGTCDGWRVRQHKAI